MIWLLLLVALQSFLSENLWKQVADIEFVPDTFFGTTLRLIECFLHVWSDLATEVLTERKNASGVRVSHLE
jgi:hypothetical protein